MAIDHRIIQSIGVRNNAPVLNMFQDTLNAAQNRNIAAAQESRRAELAPFQLQQHQQTSDINQQSINQERQKQRLVNIHQTGQRLKPLLESGNIQGAEQFLQNNIAQIQARIEQGSGEDVTESMDALAKLQAGDTQGLLGDINAVSNLVNQSGATAGQREFASLTTGLSKEDKAKAARIKLRLDPGASLTGQERIALNDELGEKVVKQLEAEAGAKEGGKLKQQRKHLPEIRSAIKLAEAAATEQGEVLTDLSRAEAGLPGLIEATNNLKELAAVATSTFGGRFFDSIAKESGWGSTKGANARAKYIAIIDNQVLPLLKQTFGGAMTEGEGQKLTNTFGDPNASPEQKMLQTEAFIEQKLRDIERLKLQAGIAPTESANNSGVPEVDISTLSIEELIAERNRLGGQ